jgi:phage tail sheath protein FI
MEAAQLLNPMRDGLDLLFAIEDTSVALFGRSLVGNLSVADSSDADRSLTVLLANGNDGERPVAGGAQGYEGAVHDDQNTRTGLKALESIDEISIIAAPGSTFGFESGYESEANTILSLLISHAEQMRYRIAVLDSGDNQTVSQIRAMRAKFDSKYAALYSTRGVYKAPTNEVVSLSVGFELLLNQGQQDVLIAKGINCFRSFEGRGYKLWGARTISSDPEWKYVNLRRYFAYLEHSIDKGTQWAVFEPNGELLWVNVKRTVEEFLSNEWKSGGLLGDKPEKAYFVRCDRSTMDQNDLDSGRLVCLIGVAPLRPSEFVIFRIGQWTADKRC